MTKNPKVLPHLPVPFVFSLALYTPVRIRSKHNSCVKIFCRCEATDALSRPNKKLAVTFAHSRVSIVESPSPVCSHANCAINSSTGSSLLAIESSMLITAAFKDLGASKYPSLTRPIRRICARLTKPIVSKDSSASSNLPSTRLLSRYSLSVWFFAAA